MNLVFIPSTVGVLAGALGLDPFFPPTGNELTLDLTFLSGMVLSAIPILAAITTEEEDEDS